MVCVLVWGHDSSVFGPVFVTAIIPIVSFIWNHLSRSDVLFIPCLCSSSVSPREMFGYESIWLSKPVKSGFVVVFWKVRLQCPLVTHVQVGAKSSYSMSQCFPNFEPTLKSQTISLIQADVTVCVSVRTHLTMTPSSTGTVTAHKQQFSQRSHPHVYECVSVCL